MCISAISGNNKIRIVNFERKIMSQPFMFTDIVGSITISSKSSLIRDLCAVTTKDLQTEEHYHPLHCIHRCTNNGTTILRRYRFNIFAISYLFPFPKFHWQSIFTIQRRHLHFSKYVLCNIAILYSLYNITGIIKLQRLYNIATCGTRLRRGACVCAHARSIHPRRLLERAPERGYKTLVHREISVSR